MVEGKDGLRHLALRDNGGGCHEQSRMMCNPKGEHPAFLMAGTKPHNSVPSQNSDDEPESLPDRCISIPCHANANDFELSLVKVMIAAAVGPRPHATNVAVIGLGGGMVPLWFQQQRPDIKVDAVDILKGIVEAVHCFGISQSNTTNVVQQDGRRFLETQPKGKYDAIMVDAFDEKDNVPGCLRTYEFFQLVKAHLKPDGGLIMNTWRKNLDLVLPALQLTWGWVEVAKSPGLGNIIVHASDKHTKVARPTPKPDNSFFGFHSKKPKKDGGPVDWLASAGFIHPQQGWVMYPQYHHDGTTPPPPTIAPLYLDYKPPPVEHDVAYGCNATQAQ